MKSFRFKWASARKAGLALAAGSLALAAPATGKDMHVYIGTYTGSGSQGIYVARFDSKTGRLSAPQLAAETRNPSFLAAHPNGRWLYAVGEIGDFAGQRTGAVSAFQMDSATGKLTLLNQQPSGGSGPCHVALDQTGRCVLVANYGSGSVAALPIQSDGRLGPAGSVVQHTGSSVNPKRQAGPHGHFITPDPANRRALACDLGLDKVLIYHLDPAGARLTPGSPADASVPPGAGPRHLAFHPRGRHVYVVNEMGCSVSVFTYSARNGAMQLLETVSTLPQGATVENTCAEIQVHPSGKFVYASNRGHDSLAIFKIEGRGARLSPVGWQPAGGKVPRHFAMTPDGQWLLVENQGSDNVVVFRIETRTGELTPTGQTIVVSKPVCVEFVPRP
jgi:6-phosphogluconolactonase